MGDIGYKSFYIIANIVEIYQLLHKVYL